MKIKERINNRLKKFFRNVLEDSLDFYFEKRYMERMVSMHELSLSRLIVEVQLYRESTAISAIYEIYRFLLGLKSIDKDRNLSKENLSSWLSHYIKTEEDWNLVSDSLTRRYRPLSYHNTFSNYNSSYEIYKDIKNYIIYLIDQECSIEADDFEKTLDIKLGEKHEKSK